MKCKYVKVNHKYYFIEDETDDVDHVVNKHYNRKTRDKTQQKLSRLNTPKSVQLSI